MSVPITSIRHQGSMLRTFGRLALSAAGIAGRGKPVPQGEWIHETVPPRPEALLDSYAEWSGAKPGRYANTVPPHLFPQWGFPLLFRTLEGLPYNVAGVINQGCRLQVHVPIPRGVPLVLKAALLSVEEDETKARLHQRIVTGFGDTAEALTGDVHAVFVKSREKRQKTASAPKETGEGAGPAGVWEAGPNEGFTYALLTGDINPIHWIGPYAKASGFSGKILHGFATFAKTCETLENAGISVRDFDVRFVKPVPLPSKIEIRTLATGGGTRVWAVSPAGVHMAGTLKGQLNGHSRG